MSNQKTPTTILLTPDRKFHSFGYAARDFYHDLDPSESKQWLYLEKFKMKLHTTAVSSTLEYTNRKQITFLIIIFSVCLCVVHTAGCWYEYRRRQRMDLKKRKKKKDKRSAS